MVRKNDLILLNKPFLLSEVDLGLLQHPRWRVCDSSYHKALHLDAAAVLDPSLIISFCNSKLLFLSYYILTEIITFEIHAFFI